MSIDHRTFPTVVTTELSSAAAGAVSIPNADCDDATRRWRMVACFASVFLSACGLDRIGGAVQRVSAQERDGIGWEISGPRVGLAAMRSGRDKRSWRWFAAWMMTGICLALGVSALGVFVVPLGLVLVAA